MEQWDATMNVNVRALFLVTQLVSRDWVSRAHRGVIVNVSSQASMVRHVLDGAAVLLTSV